MTNLTRLTQSEEEIIARHICGQAHAKLLKFFKNLRSRKITPKDLDYILNAGDFIKTREIINSFLSLKLFNEHRINVEVLDGEVNAYEVFKERNKKLMHFAHIFAELAKGLLKNNSVHYIIYIFYYIHPDDTIWIKENLQVDYTFTPVSELWECTTPPVFKFCPIGVPNDVIQEVFHLTHHEEISSSIFLKVFAKQEKSYRLKHEDATITLEKAVRELWQPMCTEFKEDLQKLSDGLKLPLDKVAYLFDDISETKKLEEELTKWCDAVRETNRTWIRGAAQKILDYQKLRRYCYTAQTLMQLKETLGLTGDFSAVEALLSKEVSVKKQISISNDSILSRTLNKVQESHLQLLKILLQKQLVFLRILLMYLVVKLVYKHFVPV